VRRWERVFGVEQAAAEANGVGKECLWGISF
jgi:hypothetical protein